MAERRYEEEARASELNDPDIGLVYRETANRNRLNLRFREEPSESGPAVLAERGIRFVYET
jgi:hypothetical protein